MRFKIFKRGRKKNLRDEKTFLKNIRFARDLANFYGFQFQEASERILKKKFVGQKFSKNFFQDIFIDISPRKFLTGKLLLRKLLTDFVFIENFWPKKFFHENF